MAANDVFAGLFRPRGNRQHRVTLVELFFDLVYVFAITQLTHLLIEDLTWRGALQTLLLTCALWWTWIDTTWIVTWLNPDKRPVRLMLLGVMLVCLIMAAMIPEAFGDRGLAFAAALVAVHVGQCLFMIRASREDQVVRRNFQRIFCWILAASAFWIVGGLVEGNARNLLWLLALGVHMTGPVVAFPVPGLGRSSVNEWATISGGHFAERCQLFLIVAFGETILLMGQTLSDASVTTGLMLAFLVAFIGTAALWWIYFSESAERAAEIIAESRNPGQLARSAYTYLHLPMVAGIVFTAVGDELSMAHPTGHADLSTVILLTGGPALFLLGHLAFKYIFSGHFSIARLVASGLLVALIPLGREMPPVGTALGAMLVLVGFIVWDARSRHAVETSGISAAGAIAGNGLEQPEEIA